MKNKKINHSKFNKLNFKQITISSFSKLEIKGGGVAPSTAGTQSWCICL